MSLENVPSVHIIYFKRKKESKNEEKKKIERKKYRKIKKKSKLFLISGVWMVGNAS